MVQATQRLGRTRMTAETNTKHQERALAVGDLVTYEYGMVGAIYKIMFIEDDGHRGEIETVNVVGGPWVCWNIAMADLSPT